MLRAMSLFFVARQSIHMRTGFIASSRSWGDNVPKDDLKTVVARAAAEVAKAARKRQEENLAELKDAKLRDQIERSGYLADLARGQVATQKRLRGARYKG